VRARLRLRLWRVKEEIEDELEYVTITSASDFHSATFHESPVLNRMGLSLYAVYSLWAILSTFFTSVLKTKAPSTQILYVGD